MFWSITRQKCKLLLYNFSDSSIQEVASFCRCMSNPLQTNHPKISRLLERAPADIAWFSRFLAIATGLHIEVLQDPQTLCCIFFQCLQLFAVYFGLAFSFSFSSGTSNHCGQLPQTGRLWFLPLLIHSLFLIDIIKIQLPLFLHFGLYCHTLLPFVGTAPHGGFWHIWTNTQDQGLCTCQIPWIKFLLNVFRIIFRRISCYQKGVELDDLVGSFHLFDSIILCCHLVPSYIGL